MAEQQKITIRPAHADDWPAVVAINDSAFGGSSESALIAAIEQSGRPTISLVACADQAPVGHIFFSPIHVQCVGPPVPAIALAPMAVSPGFQRRGIGSQLVQAGLRVSLDRGYQLVVVVGHPGFYPRFGFRPAEAMGLRSVYSEAGDAFMAVELTASALGGRTGVVEYPEEFAGV